MWHSGTVYCNVSKSLRISAISQSALLSHVRVNNAGEVDLLGFTVMLAQLLRRFRLNMKLCVQNDLCWTVLILVLLDLINSLFYMKSKADNFYATYRLFSNLHPVMCVKFCCQCGECFRVSVPN